MRLESRFEEGEGLWIDNESGPELSSFQVLFME
jgi:hypothetical protein